MWFSITLIFALDFLYDNFEMTIVPYLYSDTKDFKQIQYMITSNKAVNIAKQVTNQTATDLSMITKKKFKIGHNNSQKMTDPTKIF